MAKDIQKNDLLPGETILNGSFCIQKKLGEGTSGAAYVASDVTAGVLVTIKTVPKEVTKNDEGFDEYKRNFNLTHRLTHSNIRTPYLLQYDNHLERYFLVMKYVEGENLSKFRLKQTSGKVSFERALDICKQLANAIDYAHNNNVLHQDIKSANVIIEANSQNAVLVDFGVAEKIQTVMLQLTRLADAPNNHKQPGTPPFMAPELFRGKVATKASDIYAFGVLFYELVAGKLPFSSKDYNILKDLVATNSPDDVKGLSKSQNSVLKKVLSKNPKERHATALAFIEEIASVSDKTVFAIGVWELFSRFAVVVAIFAGFFTIADKMIQWGWIPTEKKDHQPYININRKNNSPEKNIHSEEISYAYKIFRPVASTYKAAKYNFKLLKESLATDDNSDAPGPTTVPKNHYANTSETKKQKEPIITATEKPNDDPAEIEEKEPNDGPAKTEDIVKKQKTEPNNQDETIRNRIDQLLREAKQNLINNQLTLPSDNNALKKYNAVLQLAPSNKQALKGLKKISNIFIDMAKKAEKNKEWKKTLILLDRAKLADPGSITIKKIIARINKKIALKKQPKIWTEPETGMEFVLVPKGCFMMGNPEGDEDENFVHEVCLDSFWIGRYEVTNAQFRQFRMEHNSFSTYSGTLNSDKQPVVSVSMVDTRSFSNWLSTKGNGLFRLPTEAEWEYAARGNTGKVVPWKYYYQACQYGNFSDTTAENDSSNCTDKYKPTTSIGKFPPNHFGIYDMLGNAGEWVSDYYSSTYYRISPTNNPQGPANGSARVFRGGSWYHQSTESSYTQRMKGGWGDSYFCSEVGFRLVRQTK